MTVRLEVNGVIREWDGDPALPLLRFLREELGILSPKDGCSGEGTCGACLVGMDGRAVLSCTVPVGRADGRRIVTVEGLDPGVRETLSRAFAAAGAVQCGFCSPGFLMRAALLLERDPDPDEAAIRRAFHRNLCRCTGYAQIVEATLLAAGALREGREIPLPPPGGVGARTPKLHALQRAVGASPFVDDLSVPGMLHGALRLSDHPRARVLRIDPAPALAVSGVVRVLTAADVPGERTVGLIVPDWPVLVAEGEVTRYVGDVLAVVVAGTVDAAREGARRLAVEYEVLEPVTDMLEAEESPVHVHDGGNLLEVCSFSRGDVDAALAASAHVVHRVYETQRIEHGFLETEAALAVPRPDGTLELFSQSQGVYEDRRQVAAILGVPEDRVVVTLVPNGGGFGGKEDLSVQGHAALAAHLLGRPVKVRLTRPESIRMHPKRHPIRLEYTLGCDADGMLTALRARIVGDTGAYASVGMKVLERAAGHATGAYHVPAVDIEARTVSTNNVPCGAMRGFGANQATFAMECALDELAELGGFDRWRIRWENALTEGKATATGQVLEGGVGVRRCLEAVREAFESARYVGIACGIKNTGIGNGMPDLSEVAIEIAAPDRVVIHHGWTEMGQGVDTVAVQVLAEATGIDPAMVEVVTTTRSGARGGMTTASRGTSLLGNAILDAAAPLRRDLEREGLKALAGRIYRGRWACDWTTPPGAPGRVVTHYSYGYAAQAVILDDEGRIERVVAAHDAGRIINPTLFRGQIIGSVHMGLGYALTEALPMESGRLVSDRYRDLGILRADEMPPVEIIGVEVPDPHGPYGAKGVGEIGLVPTAGAVANALWSFDGVRRTRLPMGRKPALARQR